MVGVNFRVVSRARAHRVGRGKQERNYENILKLYYGYNCNSELIPRNNKE